MWSLRTILVLLSGVISLAVLMLSSAWPLTTFSLFSLLGALLYLALKVETHHPPQHELDRLRTAYDQLDQQAKLIIRTDLELHQKQADLDRWLASLMSLYRLGQQLQVKVQPEEVFAKLDSSVVTSFGFSQGMLGLCASFETLEWRSLVGVSQSTADALLTHLTKSGWLKQVLTHPTPVTLDTISATDPDQQRILELLGVPMVVVAGLIPHTGPAGCLLLGRAGGSATKTKADEELVAILANQLTIAVENSALYEEIWAAQRELERKVQDRTRELADANEQLIRLNKAKSDFVSSVSHELRTPLAAIKGYASLLGSGQFGALDQPKSERVAKIEKHADLLTQLINNLLDIARIESGRLAMERRPIPVEDFLTTIQETVRPQLDAKQIQYHVDLDGVKELVGDAQHLQRVFINLLSNAIKYTPEHGTVRVGLRREGPTVFASVSDTGSGIASEDLPKLFQEFYRANDRVNQQIRGTGLGLALAKRIVEAHQGQLTVESQSGRGSTFTIALPAA